MNPNNNLSIRTKVNFLQYWLFAANNEFKKKIYIAELRHLPSLQPQIVFRPDSLTILKTILEIMEEGKTCLPPFMTVEFIKWEINHHSGSWFCAFCSFFTRTRQSLYFHMNSHHSKTPFRCLCGLKIMKLKDNLKHSSTCQKKPVFSDIPKDWSHLILGTITNPAGRE